MNLYHLTLRATREKYLKFKNRLEKSISSGSFEKLPRKKKNKLISRVEKMRSRLEGASLFKKGMIAAGSAAFLPAVAISQVIALPDPDPKLRFEKSGFDLNRGGSNQQIEVANIDSDADMEILMSTSSRGFLQQKVGNNFEYSYPPALNDMTGEFFVGDVNGDTHNDIVFNSGFNFYLAFNDGEGNFELTDQEYLVSASFVPGVIGREYSTEDVDLVDFDSDGDLDLVIANRNSNLKIFKNDGEGNFASATYLSTGATYGITEFEFGKFDDDDDLDLMFSATYGGDYDELHVVENTAGVAADPVFTGAIAYLSDNASSALEITILDVDGDGDLDIFTNQSYSEVLFLNQSSEGSDFSFNEPAIEGLSFSGSVVDVAVADLDGDGVDDLLLAFSGLYDDPHVAIFEDGVLSATRRSLNGDIADVTRAFISVAIGDLDGDGLNDVVGVDASILDPYIYFDRSAPRLSGWVGDNIIDENKPAGVIGKLSFSDFHGDDITAYGLSGSDAGSFTWNPVTNELSSNEAFDWEENGSSFDLSFTLTDGIKARTEKLNVRLNNIAEKGPGLLREQSVRLNLNNNNYLQNFTPVDFDVDGDQDIFFGEDHMLVNNDLGFQEQFINGFSSGATEVAFADFDLDGDLDLFGKDAFAIYSQENVDKSFSTDGWNIYDTYFIGSGSFGLIAGDFDNDGQKELGFINYSGGESNFRTLEVLNDGRSGLVLDQDILLQSSVGGGYMGGFGQFVDIAVADFDGDGNDDLLVITEAGGESPGTDAIFSGTPSSGFDTNITQLTANADNGFNRVEVGDLNADGAPDIAFMKSNGVSVDIDIMINDGSGGFTIDQTLSVEGEAGTGSFDMKLGDMDGDGVLDIVASGGDIDDNYHFKMWANDGDGSFSLLQTTYASGYELELMDIDGDDDLDVIIREYLDNGGEGEGYLNVHLNVNFKATDISLSSNSLDEHLPEDTQIALITVTDENTTDDHVITLAKGDGTNDANNNFFAINGNELIITRDVSFENFPTLNILLAADDGENIYYQALTLTVNQVNVAPTAITAPTNFNEGTAPGTSIGTLSATDDGVETVTFALATGDGTNDADNGSFVVNGDQLIIKDASSFETKSSYSIYLSASDRDGSVEQAFTINVNNVNEFPTAITLSSTSLDETLVAGSAVATIDATDTNTADEHEFELVAGDGTNDMDNSKFVIQGDQLIIKQNSSFETQSSYNIYISASDGEGSVEQAFTITVNNTNELPTAITLSANSVDETVSSGSAIATIDATDANTTDEHEFELTTGDGSNDADNSKFIIDGDQLVIKTSPDFSTQSSYNIYLSAADSEGSVEQAFTITVNEFVSSNNAPTGILLSSTSFDEGIDGGSSVATLTAEDADTGDTHTFSFVTGDGSNDSDNSKFLLDGNQLVIKSSPSFEAQASYNIYLSTSDDEDSFQQAFTLTVNNLNTAPTGIQLSSTSFDEGIAGGSSVSTLTAEDSDTGDTHNFKLAAGDGTNDADNGKFVIDGDQLVIKASPSFETQSSYNINLSAADSEGSVTQAFTLTVNNVNELPTAITLSSSTINEDTPAGSSVATIDATDVNASDEHVFKLVSGDGTNDVDNSKFVIEGDQLIIKQNSRFETQASYRINMSASDSEGGILQAFVIDVIDVNQAPNSITLSITSLDESVSPGSTAATISVTDPNAGDTHTFTLVEGDGTNDQHNDLFVINGNRLILVEGVEFDNLQTININLRASDGQESLTRSFALVVNEVLGIADEIANALGVYPNPGGAEFNINFDNAYRGDIQIRVSDLSGREIHNLTSRKVAESFTFNVDMSDAKSGIYVIELVTEDDIITQRWVKQ